MQPIWVALVYGSALILAVVLVYEFRTKWYWHALSVAAGLAVGLTPPPQGWQPPDLAVGFVFVFLMAWGLGAPFFRLDRRPAEKRKAHQA